MDQITTYATLQAAMAGMIHRGSDTSITANAPLFIQLAEGDMFDDILSREQEVETTLTATVDQNYVALPTGYISPIALWLVVNGLRTLLTPDLPEFLPYSTTSGQMSRWAIDGENIRFDCPADATYSLPFRFMGSSALSDSNTTNYLLDRRPDLYLAAAMRQVAMFTRDTDGLANWDRLYLAAKQSFKNSESRSRFMVPLRTEIQSLNSWNIYRDS